MTGGGSLAAAPQAPMSHPRLTSKDAQPHRRDEPSTAALQSSSLELRRDLAPTVAFALKRKGPALHLWTPGWLRLCSRRNRWVRGQDLNL